MRFITRSPSSAGFRASIVLLLLAAPVLCAKQVVERYDDGTVHFSYQVDFAGRRDGDFQEYSKSGALKVHGAYAGDKKTGVWTTFDDQGTAREVAHWKDGLLDGMFQRRFASGDVQMRAAYRAGEFLGPITTYDQGGNVLVGVSYPRPLADVERIWNSLAPTSRDAPKYAEEPKLSAPYAAGKLADETLTAAAHYVMLYRCLCGLPEEDLRIDPHLCDLAQHGAVVVAKLGLINHSPDKPPDMDDAFFKLGYLGCHQSNLFQGMPTLFDAIDSFMADADASNIEKIGHRQWILCPGLDRTGFGSVSNFTAMHVLSAQPGGSGGRVIAYPGPGYYPRQLLGRGAPWSVHLNRSRFKVSAAEDVTVSVESLDDDFAEGESTAGTIVNVMTNDTANWTSIVFQPGRDRLGAGKYLVKIAGVRTPSGAELPFSYLVDLRDMPAPKGPQVTSR